MENTFNQKKMMGIIIDEIKSATGLDCVEQSTVKQPDYPFYTFRNVTSHTSIGFTDNVDSEEFEMTLHFDAHSLSMYEATDYAEKLHKLFQTQEFDILSAQNNFYIIDCDDIENTDNPISIQVERQSGFNVPIRVVDNFKDDKTTIDNIEINGGQLTNKEG